MRMNNIEKEFFNTFEIKPTHNEYCFLDRGKKLAPGEPCKHKGCEHYKIKHY